MTDVLSVMERPPQIDAVIPAVPDVQPVFRPINLRTSSELAALPLSELSAIIGQDVAGLDHQTILRRARDAQLAQLFPLKPRKSAPLPQAAVEIVEPAIVVPERKPNILRTYTQEERDSFMQGLLDRLVAHPVSVPEVKPEPVFEEETGKPISWLADLVGESTLTDPEEAQLYLNEFQKITEEIPVVAAEKAKRGNFLTRVLGRGAILGTLITALSWTGSAETDSQTAKEAVSATTLASINTESPIVTSEVTTTAIEEEISTTTTEKPPKSLVQQVYDGEISMWDTAGKRFDSMSMSAPGMCLDDIHLYGSNFASIEDERLQTEFFIPNGLMSADEAERINNGTMPYAQKASIYERFDPTYYVAIDETPQASCDAITDSANPPRWDKLPTGSQSALDFANNGISLGNVQPTAEFDLEAGVMPGQLGNVVVAAHNRTQGGAFWNLDALGPGDIVTFTDKDLGQVSYVFEKSEILLPTVEAGQQIINYKSDWSDSTLTLYACFKGDDGVSYRRIVRLVLVKE